MDIKGKKVIKLVFTIVIIILLVLFWLLIGGKSFAQYKSEKNVKNDVLKIEEPIFIVDGAENIKIDGKEETVYHFSVKNYDETRISEVDFEYEIEIVNDSNQDLQFELCKDGNSVRLENHKTNSMFLPCLEKQNHEYTLYIKYRNQPANIEDIEGNVQIKTQAVQTRRIEEG